MRAPVRLLLIFATLAFLGVAAFWFRNTRDGLRGVAGPIDPRLETAKTWPNVHPDVAYIGSERCSGCHETIAKNFGRHPMGISLGIVRDFPRIEDYKTKRDFTSQGYLYDVRFENEKLYHRERVIDKGGENVIEHEAEIVYVLGSGTRGRSYLIENDGRLFQSPISWYTQKSLWDLAPGYHKKNPHFERQVVKECLYCHANQVKADAQSINRYEQPVFRGHAIGCERCHGPGSLHAERQESLESFKGFDKTIVNPARLEFKLRDAVCEQCHLQGETQVVRFGRDIFEYRPGTPIQAFQNVFVYPPEHSEYRAVGHVEQMEISVCRQKSGGKLGCVSCHDPHRAPAPKERAEFYRKKCLNCHTAPAVQCSESAPVRRKVEDDCASCHMPRRESDDIAHTSVSDHRILRTPKKQDARKPPPGVVSAPPTPFHRSGAADAFAQRDLGIALTRLGAKAGAGRAPREVLGLLDPHLTKWPKDSAALEAKALMLSVANKDAEAFELLAAHLRSAPPEESILVRAATLAATLNKGEQARKLWEELVQMNPHVSDYPITLGSVYAQSGDWTKAAESLRQGLKIAPTRLDARKLRIQCLANSGDRPAAQRELAIYSRLGAGDHEELRRQLGLGP